MPDPAALPFSPMLLVIVPAAAIPVLAVVANYRLSAALNMTACALTLVVAL